MLFCRAIYVYLILCTDFLFNEWGGILNRNTINRYQRADLKNVLELTFILDVLIIMFEAEKLIFVLLVWEKGVVGESKCGGA